ncbi:hypothetical protein ISG33_16450 [Glaciecola sp. MH2013]|uniref:hypothetical protein n=1 Tax=Glaciecola sp. MH2013 TaxID=2785524 RepID=UPI00189CA7AA|nr:hypothetical protein [Glaciecola sp. MH2013]MBF7074993.1 hypothetical protein [Glaciecola sp. MH2013]
MNRTKSSSKTHSAKLPALSISLVILTIFFIQACESDSSTIHSQIAQSIENTESVEPMRLDGQWLLEPYGDVMLNPQTSGLKYHNGKLYSLSDASADRSQIKRLHEIDMDSAKITQKFGPSSVHERVQNSCFYDYLQNAPDYEALVPVHDNLASANAQSTWVFVTEDASRVAPLSPACQTKFAATGSTLYPTLLVRMEVNGASLELTHVRAVQFPTKKNLGNNSFVEVGDFPNDGIEGLALTRDGKLLLGLEKDAAGQPRVFSINMNEDFWLQDGFAVAKDTELLLPKFESGNHPINGMDVYYPDDESRGYLLAAARNDNELWVIDLAKEKATKRIKLAFTAPSRFADNPDSRCEARYLMNNASIEGLAVANGSIWMVNDPWKINYMKNVQCEADAATFEKMAPLIFQMPVASLGL